MPRRVYSFDQPDRFVCGTLGEPGQRTFFLQATKGSRVVSVALEKAQVAALAERLATLLLALRQGGVEIGEEPLAGVPELAQPVVEQFRVGVLSFGWNEERGRIVIEAREFDEGDIADEEEDVDAAVEELAGPAEVEADDEGPDVVRVHLDPPAALAFASGALAVVQAGRPPCPQCGAPLEPTGHFCPRRNGYTH